MLCLVFPDRSRLAEKVDSPALLTNSGRSGRVKAMNAAPIPPAPETEKPVSNAAPEALVEDDDFGDVELGERQPEVCTMDEGCTTCQ